MREMPEEIKVVLKALADDDRLGIIIALLKNGKLTFSEIKDEFQMNPSSLTHHLNLLQNGNLVTNFYEKGDGKAFSYYAATDIPELILDSLIDIFFKSNIEKKYETLKGTDQDDYVEKISAKKKIEYSKIKKFRILDTENTSQLNVASAS